MAEKKYFIIRVVSLTASVSVGSVLYLLMGVWERERSTFHDSMPVKSVTDMYKGS